MTTPPKRQRKGKATPGTGASEAATPSRATASAEEPCREAVPAVAPAAAAEPAAAASAAAPTQQAPTVAGGAPDETVSPEERRQDDAAVDRVEHLAREVAWLLVAAGVVGVVMPGVLGTPFLIAGAAALWPGNRKRFQRWREGHSPRFFHGSMKQINRFLDDLERRYPRRGADRRRENP